MPRRTLALLVALSALLPAAAAALITPPSANLLFTAIQPCRIIDTRNATAGRLVAGVRRNFSIVGSAANFSAQGGNPTGCGIPGKDTNNFNQTQAVMLNLVAVAASGPGDLVAWSPDFAQPTASVINYAASSSLSGLNIANAIVIGVSQSDPEDGDDLAVLAQVNGAHLVADVVGYFSHVSPGTVSAFDNVFLGRGAGNQFVATGFDNVALGVEALPNLTSSQANTAVGNDAMFSVQSGSGNTAVGQHTLADVTSGTGNIALGINAGDSLPGGGTSNIDIGNEGTASDSFTIRIGTTQTAAFISGINGATASSGATVLVDANGKLGTQSSSLRFKEDIESIGEASDGLMKLRPVMFRYRPEYDGPEHLLQYGLVAEEVAQVYPDLVQKDKDGRPELVRYHFVNAMLLNEVQKQHRVISDQEKRIEALESMVKALAASARVDHSD